MTFSEPLGTALVLAVAGLLLAVSAISSRASSVVGLPVMLVFLAVGMLAGSEGVGGIHFEDYDLTFRLGTAALVLILFDGGLNTSRSQLRSGLAPASVLATLGVVLTAAIVAGAAWLLGFGLLEAMLLGAVVSSTDAAAVFSILRGSTFQLRRRVGSTLDLESGLNDPVAVILTFALTEAVAGDVPDALGFVPAVVLQLALGAGLGIAVGWIASGALRRLGPGIVSLYPVLTLSTAFLAFGIPTLFGGSGFLAVYVAGFVIGNGRMPHRTNLLHAHDFMAWLAQVGMFLTLGLLAFPSRLLDASLVGLGLALALVFVARPIAVAACLAPFGFPRNELAFVAAVGLRGAVPIILATFPIQAGLDVGTEIFDVVFFVVLVSVLLQGGAVRTLARRFAVDVPASPLPHAVMEISSHRPIDARVLPFYVSPALAVANATIAEIPFPRTSAIVLVLRGHDLVVPRGDVVLTPGDHVYVLFPPEDEASVRLLFGAAEDD